MGRSQYLYVTLAGILLVSGCTGPPRYTTKTQAEPAPASVEQPAVASTGTADSDRSMRDRFRSIYMKLAGIRYRYGGETSNGYDCSGLVQQVFWDYGKIQLPRTVREMYHCGDPVNGSRLHTGDLVFFNTTGRGASHVGVYLWDNMFLHASTSEGVTITELSDDYWSARYIGARRILN